MTANLVILFTFNYTKELIIYQFFCSLILDNQCKPCPGTPGSDCTYCDNTPFPSFEPPCNEGNKPGLCSGNQASKWGAVSVVDHVRVPSNLKPGKYVVGWRLDCEATAQVWSNCADIVLTN